MLLVVIPHTFGVIPYYRLQLRAIIFDSEALIGLLLGLTNKKLGVGVVNNIFDLIHHTVLEQPHTDPAGTHGGHLCP